MSVIGCTVLALAEGLWDSGWRGLCGGGGGRGGGGGQRGQRARPSRALT